jgi:succinylarginine dihydrolase
MSNKKTSEVNFDGLVGPTHNYAGLSAGNLASEEHEGRSSNPREAALQGLEKMKFVHDLGLIQGIITPHPRPNKAISDLRIAFSASSMWTANAATVSPSADTQDGRVHFTVANLSTNPHRAQEASYTYKILKTIFHNTGKFSVHEALDPKIYGGDEGAANHCRVCDTHGQRGIEIFVYGMSLQKTLSKPQKHPARQSCKSCEAIAENHLLNPDKVVFVQQNPAVIDQGVFHNDVISVANENIFLYHEEAFVNTENLIQELKDKISGKLCAIEISSQELSVSEAVSSYLFNSQIITLPNARGMALIAPEECLVNLKTKNIIEKIIKDSSNPIVEVYYKNLKQSMSNGGGPACLRLRVVLTEDELKACEQGVFLNERLYHKLKEYIQKYYRTHLDLKTLSDTGFAEEALEVSAGISEILFGASL